MTVRLTIQDDSLKIGRFFGVSFQRTLRLPDDGHTYPLPPGLGRFPLRRVRDYARRVPAAWRQRGGVFLPMYQREALWLSFEGPSWHPNALKIGVGGVNAVSGAAFDDRLRRRPQDYLVVPDQPWLDGINAGRGFIRQFVALPLGTGETVEGQVTGREEEGGIQLTIVAARRGRFPEQAPQRERGPADGVMCCSMVSEPSMGLGAGGRMEQCLYPDPNERSTWDAKTASSVHVHIATSEAWQRITGEEPPPSPISAETYTDYGFPWFRLYNEEKGDVEPSSILAGVKGIGAPPSTSLATLSLKDGQVVAIWK